MDAPAQRRRTGFSAVSARLTGPVTLQPQADGAIVACFGDQSVSLGRFSAAAAARAGKLGDGITMVTPRTAVETEVEVLLRRLAQRGLLEYGVARGRGGDEQAVVEPQTPGYWPHETELGPADTVVLSRFACLRRRGNDLILESPRSEAVFRIRDPATVAMLAGLVTPQRISRLRRQDGFPGAALLGLLADSRMVFVTAPGDDGGRASEGDGDLVLWDFHDLLFHTRSTAGRHANPLGGMYRYADAIPPLPAVRPPWPGQPVDLAAAAGTAPAAPLAALLRERHSTREFDAGDPITVAELARFLDATARVLWQSDFGEDGSPEIAPRPYPSAGSSYELELYLAVDRCEGLAAGFYHYDAGGHALVAVPVPAPGLEALFAEAMYSTAARSVPQVLIVIAARFARVSWKYASLAYSLVLKDTGALLQTFYLMATQMGLGGCAAGISNIELFAWMTGLNFHVEGPVGGFLLGRPDPEEAEPPPAGAGPGSPPHP